MWKVFIIFNLSLDFFEGVLGGNYRACPYNPCANDGNCLLMSNSPSPLELDPSQAQSQAFFHSHEPKDWYQARTFCLANSAALFNPEIGTIGIDQAQEFMKIGSMDLPDKVDGYWLENVLDMKCEVIFKDTFELALVPCTLKGFFAPLCILKRDPNYTQETSEYLYTCQCLKNYGSENCTAAFNDSTPTSPRTPLTTLTATKPSSTRQSTDDTTRSLPIKSIQSGQNPLNAWGDDYEAYDDEDRITEDDFTSLGSTASSRLTTERIPTTSTTTTTATITPTSPITPTSTPTTTASTTPPTSTSTTTTTPTTTTYHPAFSSTVAPVFEGKTFCQVQDLADADDATQVLLKANNINNVIIVDHFAYGRPFYLDQSLTGPDFFVCKMSLFADDEDSYCVAPNSLAAVIYWCQGKSSCNLNPELLIDAEDFRDVFIVGIQATSLLEAQNICHERNGILASPKEDREFEDLWGDQDLFWISPRTLESMAHLVPSPTQASDQCILIQSGDPVGFKWTPCQGLTSGYPVVCQSSFGFSLRTAHELPSGRIDPEDFSCIDTIKKSIIEYRYHEESNFGSAHIACPMHVDYRRGNTCYKKTGIKSWKEARRQCWQWGGELAFTMSRRDDPEECNKKIYLQQTEELWMASNQTCPEGGARCVVSFSDDIFEDGTYDSSNDICYPTIGVDQSCELGSCQKLRRGLCALAPAHQPRTHLPAMINCPKKAPGDLGWPYTDYSWNIEGQPGQRTSQPCPEGQEGRASWQCGFDGDWIRFPDMRNCSKIVIEEIINELEDENSVPADVIEDFYNNIAGDEELGTGDVGQVLTVLDRAIEVQVQKIDQSEDPAAYADSFTKQGVNILDDLLRRSSVWVGLHEEEKIEKLNMVQVSLDSITQSIMKYSKSAEHFYTSPYKSVEVKISRNVMSAIGESYSTGNSKITVSGPDNGEKISISFHSFATFGCLLNNRPDCSTLGVDPGEDNVQDLVNSVVLGATLYDGPQKLVTHSKDVDVKLEFFYQFTGDKYNLSEPNCGYWDESSWSSDGCELVESGTDFSTCHCDHLTNFGIILDINGNLEGQVILNYVLSWITIVGCTLSIISLVICIYVFASVKALRGERTTIHMNLCISLLLAEILLLSGLDATGNPVICGTIAGFLHFFFLAAFFWMLVEGIHVYFKLVKVFLLEKSPLWTYFLIGYGTPVLIVGLSVTIVESTGTHGYGTERSCWLDYENGLIWAFAGPVIVIIVANTLMFGKALLIARKTLRARPSPTGVRDNESANKTNLKLAKGSFSLLCILGLTWIFGFIYFAEGAEWLAIIFALLNSFQGVFILIFHVIMNDTARKDVTKHINSTFPSIGSMFKFDQFDRSFREFTITESQGQSQTQNNNVKKRGKISVISLRTKSSFVTRSRDIEETSCDSGGQ